MKDVMVLAFECGKVCDVESLSTFRQHLSF